MSEVVLDEYVVMAELKSGSVRKLRGGFTSKEAAMAHPVDHSLWNKVWVQASGEKLGLPDPEDLPPFPWDLQTSGTASANGQFHAYLVDANGKKFAALWGSAKQKELIASLILSKCSPIAAASEPVEWTEDNRNPEAKKGSALWNLEEDAAFVALTPIQRAEWNRYCQAAAEEFERDNFALDRTIHTVHQWRPNGVSILRWITERGYATSPVPAPME